MQVQFYKSAALPTELCGHKQARILGLTPPQSNLQQEDFFNSFAPDFRPRQNSGLISSTARANQRFAGSLSYAKTWRRHCLRDRPGYGQTTRCNPARGSGQLRYLILSSSPALNSNQ